MNKEKIGFQALIKVIGEQFFKEHEDNAVFSYGEENKGLYCFLGISLHPSDRLNGLSASIDDWDIYASCYVTDTDVIMDKCRLPEKSEGLS